MLRRNLQNEWVRLIFKIHKHRSPIGQKFYVPIISPQDKSWLPIPLYFLPHQPNIQDTKYGQLRFIKCAQDTTYCSHLLFYIWQKHKLLTNNSKRFILNSHVFLLITKRRIFQVLHILKTTGNPSHYRKVQVLHNDPNYNKHFCKHKSWITYFLPTSGLWS